MIVAVSLIVLFHLYYNDVIMGATASQITSLMSVYPDVYSGADQRKHQSSASLAFVRGIRRCPVNYPHKGPVTRKMFPFVEVIMNSTAFASHPKTTNIYHISAWLISELRWINSISKTWVSARFRIIIPVSSNFDSWHRRASAINV